MLTGLTRGGGVGGMLTMADKGGRGGFGEILTLAEKGERGGLDPPFLAEIFVKSPLDIEQSTVNDVQQLYLLQSATAVFSSL